MSKKMSISSKYDYLLDEIDGFDHSKGCTIPGDLAEYLEAEKKLDQESLYNLFSVFFPDRVVNSTLFGPLCFVDITDDSSLDQKTSYFYLQKNKEFFDFLENWDKSKPLSVTFIYDQYNDEYEYRFENDADDCKVKSLMGRYSLIKLRDDDSGSEFVIPTPVFFDAIDGSGIPAALLFFSKTFGLPSTNIISILRYEIKNVLAASDHNDVAGNEEKSVLDVQKFFENLGFTLNAKICFIDDDNDYDYDYDDNNDNDNDKYDDELNQLDPEESVEKNVFFSCYLLDSKLAGNCASGTYSFLQKIFSKDKYPDLNFNMFEGFEGDRNFLFKEIGFNEKLSFSEKQYKILVRYPYFKKVVDYIKSKQFNPEYTKYVLNNPNIYSEEEKEKIFQMLKDGEYDEWLIRMLLRGNGKYLINDILSELIEAGFSNILNELGYV